MNEYYCKMAENMLDLKAIETSSLRNKILDIEDNNTDPDTQFEFSPCTEREMMSCLKKLKNGKIDARGITSNIVKTLSITLSKYLTLVFNESIQNNLFPSNLKEGVIKPIAKGKEIKSEKDLRPITILPIEIIIISQINRFLVKECIIPDRCHGFRKFHSTETLLLSLNEQCRIALNNNKICFLLLFDFSKAFDQLDHGILINKLHSYGFSKKSLLWILSYLRGRLVTTEYNGSISDPMEISYGVPQGSVLGPLLFNIFSYELKSVVKDSLTFQYADDTQILVTIDVKDKHLI